MSAYKKKTGIKSPDRIIIAVEGHKREKQYFDWFASFKRGITIKVLEPKLEFDEFGNRIDDVGKVKPADLLERLIRYAEDHRNSVEAHDQIWLVLDADKFNVYHEVENFLRDLANSKLIAQNRNLVLSMPCFEIWLHLHIADVPDNNSFNNCEPVKALVGTLNGGAGFDSKRHITKGNVAEAIARAKALDKTPNLIMPANPGTKVYNLAEVLLQIINRDD